jgi:hypothetical protein
MANDPSSLLEYSLGWITGRIGVGKVGLGVIIAGHGFMAESDAESE